ncbi:hypothetical protein KKP91_04045 [Methanothermococcus sp. SCGC AD-155-M21]|nr:hypothetical protein [Methanothermococcus sp. SCGC AD-155-M21]
MKNLVVVDYDKDTERKRIDYLIEKWSDRGKVDKIRKMAILVDVDNIDEFVNNIMSRLEGDPEEKVKVYEIKKIENPISSKKIMLKYEIFNKKEGVITFLNYLMTKLGASYEYSIDNMKKYEVYTKKGKCSISIKLYEDFQCLNPSEKENKNKLKINFEIQGYGESVDLIKNKIDNDMKLFIEGLL